MSRPLREILDELAERVKELRAEKGAPELAPKYALALVDGASHLVKLARDRRGLLPDKVRVYLTGAEDELDACQRHLVDIVKGRT